jgi:hypothetical protein
VKLQHLGKAAAIAHRSTKKKMLLAIGKSLPRKAPCTIWVCVDPTTVL